MEQIVEFLGRAKISATDLRALRALEHLEDLTADCCMFHVYSRHIAYPGWSILVLLAWGTGQKNPVSHFQLAVAFKKVLSIHLYFHIILYWIFWSHVTVDYAVAFGFQIRDEIVTQVILQMELFSQVRILQGSQ